MSWSSDLDAAFAEQVSVLSEQTIQLCYHCHKCTAGCPVATEMDYGPDLVLRMVQLGEREEAASAATISGCAPHARPAARAARTRSISPG